MRPSILRKITALLKSTDLSVRHIKNAFKATSGVGTTTAHQSLGKVIRKLTITVVFRIPEQTAVEGVVRLLGQMQRLWLGFLSECCRDVVRLPVLTTVEM